MPEKAGDDVRDVAAAIVRYLSAHPGAADTVDGVARWWLGQRPAVALVERAMALLVREGVAERHALPDGTTVFRAGPRLARGGRTDD